jgi:hypothetical protein
VQFAAPTTTSLTRTVRGRTGGVAVVVGLIVAALTAAGLGAERLLTRRSRRVAGAAS